MDLQATTQLVGAGARSTIIDANGASRVFTASGDNRIEGVTITGGRADVGLLDPADGGGILSGGTLTLVNSTVTGNSAAFSGGGVASTTLFEGGDPGLVTITGSTINGNQVSGGAGNGQGGGVTTFGGLTMTNTTVTNNSAENTGNNQGGGVLAADGDTTLRNVTIASNTTSGATDLGAGVAGDNLGVPPAASQLTATNTIVAGNTHNGTASDCGLVNTVATDNNLSSDDSCDFDDSGSKENTNPQLQGLADNSGPTNTRKFAQGAPPYNAGVAANCPATDQRGVSRPQQGTCDIGAVELAPPTATTGGASGVTTRSATLLGTSANPLLSAGTVSFEFGTTTGYGRTIPAGGVAAEATENESAPAGALAPNTLYHYRLTAQNGDGVSRGADRTFITPAVVVPPQPVPPTLSRPSVSVGGVRRSCVRRAFTIRVRVGVNSATRLKSVRVTLDGRTIRRSSRRSFRVRVNARRLSSGRHTLRIRAVDRGNRTRTATRRFSRCARVPAARPRFTG